MFECDFEETMAKVPVAEGASDKIYVRCNMGSVLSPAHYVSPHPCLQH